MGRRRCLRQQASAHSLWARALASEAIRTSGPDPRAVQYCAVANTVGRGGRNNFPAYFSDPGHPFQIDPGQRFSVIPDRREAHECLL